ncbi:hypothetical protein [Pseudonocardia acaciae]|uniref:hypothetical protein n=1 Tax=Pseudonocardia acaciae TaxID=551276 RepID=UPI0012ECD1C7|nr:hypothetical protein [Pseudonocardia acaciae]
MRSIIETGRPIVIIVESPGGQRARLVGYIRSISRESGGVADELVVHGEAKPLTDS